MQRSHRLDARARMLVATVAAAAALFGSGSAAAPYQTGVLRAKETLRFEASGGERRRAQVPLRVSGDSFVLFGAGAASGAIVAGRRGGESWRLDLHGVQALEERLTDWVRGGAAALDPQLAEEARVEIAELVVRGRRGGKGGRTALAARARVVVSFPGSESREGVYRLRARGVLGEPEAAVGVLEEGWIPGPYGPIRSRYRIVGERAIVGGDVVVPLDELRELQERVASGALAPFEGGAGVVPHAAIAKKGWPEGRIPYEVSDDIEETQREAIDAAIAHWNERTEVRLVPRNREKTYVRFAPIEDDGNCYAPLGYANTERARVVELSPGCGRGEIIHEIGHVVGLIHEHQRDDRDTYVSFDEDAVDPDFAYAFDPKGTVFGPYNYRSIMHYGRYFFSANGDPTLTPLRDLPWGVPLGQTTELSKGDAAAANYLVTGDPRLFSNPYSQVWAEYLAPDAHQYAVGDATGGGRLDLVAFGGDDGSVFVAAGVAAGGFTQASRWLSGFCDEDLHCLLGDVNGDGRADVVEGERGRVAFSTGVSFGRLAALAGGMGGFDRFFLADVNRDSRADLVGVVGGGRLPAEVYVALSNGNGFSPKTWWGDFEADAYAVGDVDGDGRADFVARHGGEIFVSLSDGEGFGAPAPWWRPAGWFPGAPGFELADVNGDRRADLVSLSPLGPEYAGRVMTALSTGREFRGDVVNYHELDCQNEAGCLIADVDCDGLADLVDPVSTRRGQQHAARLAGDVLVSRSTSFVTDSIGSLKPVLGDAALLGRACSQPAVQR